jgi:conjugative relaxase-like TrwC/TraI family protein
MPFLFSLFMVRFDKPCLRVKGAVEYFREHMGIGDYLNQGGQADLTWYGRGAERLGLKGQCRPEDFENLCRRRHPRTGEKLTVRDRGTAGRVCYFGQISPPKYVSLACLVGGDERIRAWWDEAVRETLQEMEALTATRVRRNGADDDRHTGNMVAAIVTHEASRALDPQLHTHVAILNVTYDEAERRWKSVQPSGYYRHQGFLREVCYNKLAGKLLAAGYELEPARKLGFTIKGLPSSLRDTFSKRRKQILREAQAIRAVTQDGLQAVAGQSRDAKVNATAAELRTRWQRDAGADAELLHAVIAAAVGRQPTLIVLEPVTVLSSVVNHLFERQSVVDERDLLREALIAGRGRTSPAALRGAVADRLAIGELLRTGDDIASRETLIAEEEFVTWADAHRHDATPLNPTAETDGLDADQREAVQAILRSPSRVMILQGDAGTGKTTCLKAVVSAIEQGGAQVFGCAPSSGAADVLRRELTPEADTLQQLLVNPALQDRIRDRVLIVDEAGLISVRQMRDLCRIAQAQHCRLLLVGDTKQHSSVEAGDALRCLQKFGQVPAVRLTKIRRQQNLAYRVAVSLLARGQAAAAFLQFSRLGAVREIKQPAGLFRAAAEDYVRTVRSGKTCLAISPVWAEIHAFTAEVRQRLKAAGLLQPSERYIEVVHSLGWTREQMHRVADYKPGDVLAFHRREAEFASGDLARVIRREGHSLVLRKADGVECHLDPVKVAGFDVGLSHELVVAVGDRLLIRANCKPAKIKNGDVVEVKDFSADGSLVLTDGRHIPSIFRQFSHGYATTSHASQGKTVARGLLLMADAGLQAANLKQAYVSSSRFQESQAIYTTDKQAARAAMQRPADRRLAREVFGAVTTVAASFRQKFLHQVFNSRVVPLAVEMLRGRMDTLAFPMKTADRRSVPTHEPQAPARSQAE